MLSHTTETHTHTHYWNALTLLKCSLAHYENTVTHHWDFCIMNAIWVEIEGILLLWRTDVFPGTFWWTNKSCCVIQRYFGIGRVWTLSNAASRQLPQEPTEWRANLEHYFHLSAAVVRHSQLLAPSGFMCRNFKLSSALAYGQQKQEEVVEVDIPSALPFKLLPLFLNCIS